MNRSSCFLPALCGAGFLFTAAVSHGQIAVEYFNDYGSSQVNLNTLGSAGGGWGGGWILSGRPDYRPGEQLLYNGPGYSNAGNLGGANSGVATYELGATNSQSGQVAYRSFATPLTGTIWISFLAYMDGGSGTAAPDVLMWFNRSVNTQNYVGLRSTWVDAGNQALGYTTGAAIRYANDTSPYVGDFANQQVHLLLARLDINPTGPDSLDLWVNPTLTTGGEAGLGLANFSRSGSNAYGAGLADIGISFSGVNSMIDSIRVADEFSLAMVPEPSTYAAVLGAVVFGVGLLVRRRKRS